MHEVCNRGALSVLTICTQTRIYEGILKQEESSFGVVSFITHCLSIGSAYCFVLTVLQYRKLTQNVERSFSPSFPYLAHRSSHTALQIFKHGTQRRCHSIYLSPSPSVVLTSCSSFTHLPAIHVTDSWLMSICICVEPYLL